VKLLERYIRSKEQALSEPTRTGVRKGDKIGPSVKRMSLPLYALRDRTQAELAAELHTKQPAIARWMAEPEFEQEVAGYVREFVDRVMAFLEKKGEALKTKHGTLRFPVELQGEQYSAAVRDEMGERILETYGEDSVLGWQLVMELATEDFKIRMLDFWVDRWDQAAREVLKKSSLTADEKITIEIALDLATVYQSTLKHRYKVDIWGIPDGPNWPPEEQKRRKRRKD
jgi:hypothetical protein